MVTGLTSPQAQQLSLWHQPDNYKRQAQLMDLVASTQRQHGRKALRFGGEIATEAHTWQTRAAQRSPAYTTRWDELRVVKS